MTLHLRHIADRAQLSLASLRPEAAWLIAGGLGLLAGRATLLDGLRPFGAPFVMACAMAGQPALAALIGVCAGLLTVGFDGINAVALVPPLLVYFVTLVLTRTGRTLTLGWGMGLLALAKLVCLPLQSLLLYDVMRFAAETGLAVCALYALHTAAGAVARGRRVEDAGILVSLAVCAGVLLAGLPAWAAFSPRFLLAVLVTLATAVAGGAAVGAAGGLAVGLLLHLAGGEPTLAGVLGVCGLLCGVFRPLGRFGMAGGFWLGVVLMSAWTSAMTSLSLPWKETLVAAVAFVAVPQSVWGQLEERLKPRQALEGGDDEQRLAPLREMVVGRITDFSRCLEELAAVFGDGTNAAAEPWEDVAPLLESVANEVCPSCSRREQCWQHEFYTTYGHFLKALAAPGNRRVLLESDFPEEFRTLCRKFPDVVDALRAAWGLYRVKSNYRKRIDDSRTLAGRQLKGIATVMEELAAQLNLQIRSHEDGEQLAREALRQHGVKPISLSVRQDRAHGLVVHLSVAGCGGRRLCHGYEQVLSQALGTPLRRVNAGCGGQSASPCHLEYRQTQAMRIACAGAQRPREGVVCGDACVWDSLDDTSYFLAISDGMGTGPKAAMQSQATLSLLQRFYQAGFRDDVIYDTINQVMLLRSAGETFSTVDLCLIDLIEGAANFIKIGAPPSFLLRRGQVLTISSPTLPLGILDEVAPGATRRVLEDGDLLVLVSDGVTNNEDTEWLEELLTNWQDLEPNQVAERLLDEAAARFGRHDDMTVVAARVRLPRVGGALRRPRRRLSRWKARLAGVGGN